MYIYFFCLNPFPFIFHQSKHCECLPLCKETTYEEDQFFSRFPWQPEGKNTARVGNIPEAMTNTIPIQYHRILFILATIQYLILLVPNTGLPKQYYHGSPPPFDNSGPARLEQLRESQRRLWSSNLTPFSLSLSLSLSLFWLDTI